MFTNNWFEITAKKNFEKYLSPFKAEDTLKFLEIGCYEGQASVWLMENTQAELLVIDTFEGSEEHDKEFEKTLLDRFSDNIEGHQDRVEILIGTSERHLKTLKNETYDFIYIDGDHHAKNALEDAVLAFPLLKPGGIMIFDDYTWGQGMDLYDTPRAGIDAFLTVYGNKLEVLDKNSQAVIRKLPT